MRKAIFIAAISLVASATAIADGWTGKGEAGFVKATGNTDSENINIGLAFKNEATVWTHEFGFNVLAASSDGDDTAQSIAADYIVKRALSDRSYLFTGLNYLDDDFDSFTEQSSFSAGYGYHVIKAEDVGLELGIGIGYRDTSELLTLADSSQVEGKDLSGATGILLMNYRNKFTQNTEFVDSFRAEIGSDNSYFENDAALVVSMNERFALKAGLLMRQNSGAPEEGDETDTITIISLLYNF